MLNFMNRTDYIPHLFNLLNNLDYDSKKLLTLILKRVKDSEKGNIGDKLTYEITPEERRLWEEVNFIKKNTLQISDTLFSVNGFIIPYKYHMTETVCMPHHFKKIQNMDFIADKAIIDAGALIGDTALVFSQIACDKIYAFEPMTKQFEYLQQTIELNNLTKVIPVNKGLGKATEKIEYVSTMGSSREISKAMLEQQRAISENRIEQIEITTLDEFVKEHSIKVGFIKADIEGAEQDMLDGAKQTICEQKPILMICIYHNPEDFFFIKPKIESWDLGYTFSIVKSVSRRPMWETMLLAQVL